MAGPSEPAHAALAAPLVSTPSRPKRQRSRSSDSLSSHEAEPAASGASAAARELGSGTAAAAATADPDAALSNPEIYRLLKRAPLRGEPSRSDIYVTRGARFKVLVSRAVKRLRVQRVVRLHALGAALERCADVALAVQAQLGKDVVELGTTTETVVVYDDYEPLVPGYPARTKKRSKNALHVTLSLTDKYA